MDYLKVFDSGFRYSALVYYLREQDVWADMARIMDDYFSKNVDPLPQGLLFRYDNYLMEATGYTRLHQSQVLTDSDFYLPERQTLLDVLADRGFQYPNLDDALFTTQDYQNIARDLSRYYMERGSGSFIDYFSYVLDVDLTMESLWTDDFSSFISEEEVPTNGSIFDGGAYYPTSHVRFVVDTSVTTTADLSRYTELFNYMAPIHLVLAGPEYITMAYTTLSVCAAVIQKKIVWTNETSIKSDGDWDNTDSSWDNGASLWDNNAIITIWDAGSTVWTDSIVTTTWQE